MRSPAPMRTPTLAPPPPRSFVATALAVLPAALVFLASLSGCDAAGPEPDGPPPLDPLPSDAQALVVSAFQDVEALFDLGVGADARTASSVCCGGDGGPEPDPAALPQDRPWRDWLAQFETGGDGTPEPDGGEDLFCHVSAIMDGNALREGDTVQFVQVWCGVRTHALSWPNG